MELLKLVKRKMDVENQYGDLNNYEVHKQLEELQEEIYNELKKEADSLSTSHATPWDYSNEDSIIGSMERVINDYGIDVAINIYMSIDDYLEDHLYEFIEDSHSSSIISSLLAYMSIDERIDWVKNNLIEHNITYYDKF